MQIFISEFLTSGAWTEPLTGSLLAEGHAMASSVLRDAAAIPNAKITTTWDARLPPPPSDVQSIRPENAAHERSLFATLASRADLTYVIAPEFGGLLQQRYADVRQANGQWCGASESILRVGGDKLEFFQHLRDHSIPTIDTYLGGQRSAIHVDSADDDCSGWIIKPRHGAGAQDTLRCADLKAAVTAIQRKTNGQTGIDDDYLLQPFVVGQPWSVACVATQSGKTVLPPVRQQIATDFTFAGGVVTTNGPLHQKLTSRVRDVLNTLPSGWTGFMGFDLIVPEQASEPLVVELNPRLTTSYIGYRQLIPGLIESILLQGECSVPTKTRCSFFADGTQEDTAL